MEKGDKLSTGIDGLDEMLYGGINPRIVTGVVGPAGSGKTFASLQFLNASLKKGKTCLYVSSSHSEEELIGHSLRYGWKLEPYIKKKKLILNYIRPVDLKIAGTEIHLVSEYLNELPRVLTENIEDVVIIDSITDFIMLCKTEIESRSRLIGLIQAIKDNGSTALITAESDVHSDFTRSGIVEYVMDGVIVLRRVQSPDLSEIVHVIQVAKMRWINHLRDIRQYDFTDQGIEVYTKYNVMLGGMVHGK